MEDQEIVDLLYARSEQALQELMKKYGAAVRRIAWNILHDPLDAEECANDAYLGVWNSIPPNAPRSLGAYTCGIARNSALTRYQANTAAKRDSSYTLALEELAEYIPALGDVQTDLEARELAKSVSAFLKKQHYEDRFAFVRRYYFGDSVTEIARLLRTSPHRVSVRLFRVREKLQKSLRKEGMLP